MLSNSGEILKYNFYATSLFERGGAFASPSNYIIVNATGETVKTFLWGGLLTNQFVTPGTYSDSLTATLTY